MSSKNEDALLASDSEDQVQAKPGSSQEPPSEIHSFMKNLTEHLGTMSKAMATLAKQKNPSKRAISALGSDSEDEPMEEDSSEKDDLKAALGDPPTTEEFGQPP